MDYNDAGAYDALSHPYETFFSNLSSVTHNTAKNQLCMHWSPTADMRKEFNSRHALNQFTSYYINSHRLTSLNQFNQFRSDDNVQSVQ
jgi:hypothetical protein